MAENSNFISDVELAEWFKETYVNADPNSDEGKAYQEATDKDAFRRGAINCRKEFWLEVEEKTAILQRLSDEAEKEARDNTSEEEIEGRFRDKLFAPENDFIFDAIHPLNLSDKYGRLFDEISLMITESKFAEAEPLTDLRVKIRERMDQLISNLGDTLIIDETLSAVYDPEGLFDGYQEMMRIRKEELEGAIIEEEKDGDEEDLAALQEKLSIIVEIQKKINEAQQDVEKTDTDELIEDAKIPSKEKEPDYDIDTLSEQAGINPLDGKTEKIESLEDTPVVEIEEESTATAVVEDENSTEPDWMEKELASWNYWCTYNHIPAYILKVDNEETEGLKFDIYANEYNLDNEDKEATIHYYSQNQANIEMEEDTTPNFTIFDQLIKNVKNNEASGVAFDDAEEMTEEFKSRLAAACLNNDIPMENGPAFIDIVLLGNREYDYSIYYNEELMKKIEEYNKAQAARSSERTDNQAEEMIAREFRLTHFKNPDLTTPEGSKEYQDYKNGVASAFEKAQEEQKDLTFSAFLETRWAKMEERMTPSIDGIVLGGEPVKTEEMLRDFEEHKKNHTEHESLFGKALQDSLERSNKENKVFERFEDAAFYVGEMVKGTDTPFIRGTRDISKLNDYEKQYISEDNFNRFSKSSRIFCGKLDDFFTEDKTVEAYDEQFKLYKTDHNQGWLTRAHATPTNPQTAWQRMNELSQPKVSMQPQINRGNGR